MRTFQRFEKTAAARIAGAAQEYRAALGLADDAPVLVYVPGSDEITDQLPDPTITVAAANVATVGVLGPGVYRVTTRA